MKIKLIKIGNSKGFIVPSKILKYLSANSTNENTTFLEFDIKVDNRIIASPIEKKTEENAKSSTVLEAKHES